MPITYNATKRLWILETQNTGYAFGISGDGHIKHTYWGARITRTKDYPDLSEHQKNPWWDWNDEFPVRGEGHHTEECLKVRYNDQVRDVVLACQNHKISGDSLVVTLVDEAYKLEVDLHYRVYPENDIMEKRVVIRNLSSNEIKIDSSFSGSFYLPENNDYRLTSLTGMWGHETRIQRETVHEGKRVFESRVGRTSHFMNPFFAVDERATEEHGNVWYGLLAWSGNWKMVIHKRIYETVQIVLGVNNWDFRYSLMPGEIFETPGVFFGFSQSGFGTMSRNLHRFQQEQLLPGTDAQKHRKVLYNSWEATNFGVNEENQKALADKAADIGAEIFVVDDGWFGERNNDTAGLGDWFVNRDKFPDGLKPLIEYVNRKGMDFGLWFEPEMVNKNSRLYEQHPEWVLQFPNRPKTEIRNQLILNLAKEEVREFVYETLDRFLTELNIKFIKWDMNRPILESGWGGEKHQEKMWYQYVMNLYAIWRELKRKHPGVILESCAGGGGRVDIGIMRYADQFWTSDNTDPFDRQFIQEGFSLCYAPKTMMSWVTDWGGKNGYPLTYRFHSAMMGSLGIGADLSEYSPDELEEARGCISRYKAIRDTIQNGRLYRLMSPGKTAFTANEFVAPDHNEVVVFCLKNPAPLSLFSVLRLKLRGLDEDGVYQDTETGKDFSGSYLMNRGIDLDFHQDWEIKVNRTRHFDSKIVVYKKIN